MTSGANLILNAMKRFIVTGAPGSGKTALIRLLEVEGFSVIEEAATDVISLEQALGNAEPWKRASFIDAVANLQRQRQMRASTQPDEVQFHDRSAFCTAALAAYLGYPLSDLLMHELQRLKQDAIFQNHVFFIQNLGFITSTEARRISFEETLRFEAIHEKTYRDYGFEIVIINPATVIERAAMIKKAIQELLHHS